LAALLDKPGEVVSRETLHHFLWGADTTVDFDHSLGIALNKVRETLGDSAENPRFVETLAKRGYRFIAPVRIIDPAQADAPSIPTPAQPARWHILPALPPWIAPCLAGVCLILGLTLVVRPRQQKPFHIARSPLQATC